MKQVSAIIPNYNGVTLLKKHLPSVIDCLRDGDELLIVDDMSSDASVAYLCSEYRLEEMQSNVFQSVHSVQGKHISITVLVMPTNVRFAAAVNEGVFLAQHDLVLLLNNDVSPQKDILGHLLPYFEDNTVFAVGCKEYAGSKSGTVSGKNALWFAKGMFMHSKASNMKTGSTAWVSGGSGLFDKQKWILLGGFDKRFYPAYWEDVDLSFQAKLQGWKVLFEEHAVVVHKHETTNAATFGKNSIDAMSWRNACKFVLKNATTKQLLQHLLFKPFWLLKRIKQGSVY